MILEEMNATRQEGAMESNCLDEGRVRTYERHVAVLLSSILLGLGLYVAYEKTPEFERSGVEMISVQVVGAVTERAVTVPRGSILDEVLKKVTIEKSADVTEIDGTRRLMRDEIVVIPYIGKTTLYVKGAVIEPKVIVLEGHVRAQDVLDQVQVQENADVKCFLRRKKFVSGTVLEVKMKRARRSGALTADTTPSQQNNSEK